MTYNGQSCHGLTAASSNGHMSLCYQAIVGPQYLPQHYYHEEVGRPLQRVALLLASIT